MYPISIESTSISCSNSLDHSISAQYSLVSALGFWHSGYKTAKVVYLRLEFNRISINIFC